MKVNRALNAGVALDDALSPALPGDWLATSMATEYKKSSAAFMMGWCLAAFMDEIVSNDQDHR
ncbi:MAG: hypothetical protein ACLQU3_20580 [Limisphaerales bacterium]